MGHAWWQEKIAYQIYPKSFCDSNGDGIGDLPGICSKLDYLKDLGVDLLWVSPVYPSPMVDQGYDIADYRAIAPCFGTMGDLERLIQELKERDMHLIMDLVVNHCSSQHPWFQEAVRNPEGKYGKYFYLKEGKDGQPPNNWRAEFGGSCWERLPGSSLYYFHTFAKEQPDLNWENPEVRQEICDMVNWWLDKGVSGFRLDAIVNIKKDLRFLDGPPDAPDDTCDVSKMLPQDAGIAPFLNQLKQVCFAPRDAFTVGEVCGVRQDRLREFGGPEGYFSTLFDFDHCMTTYAGPFWHQRKPFDFKLWRDTVFQSQKNAGTEVFLSNILENHDQPRCASTYLLETDYSFYSVTALATVSLLLRGIPFLYQGQEIGMRNSRFARIEDFDDLSTRDQYQAAVKAGLTPEQALASCNRTSRDNARTPMPWSGGENAGFTSGTPWLPVNPDYQEINVEADAMRPQSVRGYYKKLLALRKDPAWMDVLIYGALQPAFQEADRLFAYYRTSETGGKRILVLCNFCPEETVISFAQPFGVLLDNYGSFERQNEQIRLKGYQAVVLRCNV